MLNGRSPSDYDGEFTFVGAVGASTIDFVAASFSCLHLINDFKVLPFPGSDHLPLEVDICASGPAVGGGVGTGVTTLQLLPKLKWTVDDDLNYGIRINENIINFQITEDNQKNITDIVECIRMSASYKPNTKKINPIIKKQPWFDYECFTKRKRVFSLLNLFRKTNSDYVRLKYIAGKKEYKLLCQNKKSRYYGKIISVLNQTSDCKALWKAINIFKKGSDNVVGNITPDKWVEHFKNLLNPPLLAGRVSYAAPFIKNGRLDCDFTLSELKIVLISVKLDKAPGPDRVPYEFLKNAPDVLLSKLLLVYNQIFKSGNVPDSFKKSIIFPLYKKGDINLVSNYRGLSFIDCIGKVFTGLINNRLQNWVNSNQIMTEFQAGFRHGYSTVDNIFSLSCMIKLRLSSKGGRLYGFFVDFTSAFDTIDRASLIYKLSCLGVSTQMTTILHNYYTGTSAGVWCKEGVTDSFSTSMGLRQGCIVSPVMFCLFVNDLPDAVGGGCIVDGNKINILMYADDIILLAPTATVLQHMINNLEKYCDIWNLRVNLSKSKIMVFRNGGKLQGGDKWWYKGERVEVVNNYKYLGVNFTTALSWNHHLKEKSRLAKLSISSMWGNLLDNRDVPLDCKFKCFNAAVRSIICYGAQVWGFEEYESVESVLKSFIKKIFRLPYNTPNYVLYLETELEKIFFYTLALNSNYITKVLSLPNHRLPNLFAKQIIKKNIYWSRAWECYGEKTGDNINFVTENLEELGLRLTGVIEGLKNAWWRECVGRARTSVNHSQLLDLDLGLGDKSPLHDNNVGVISWAIKARAELIDLNYKPWLERNYLCSLCNLNENETTFHFIAICPVFVHLRNIFFGKRTLDRVEYQQYLNGRNWRLLSKFIQEAWKYRWEIINEFNFD